MMNRLAALMLACHPVPTLGVTVISGALGVSAGLSSGTLLLMMATVLTGQLSIGWGNDALDADRDRRVGRTDKPVAAGAIERRPVVLATAATSAVTLALSFLLGFPAGFAALVIVVCGWAYNLGMRSTVLSFLPYAVAFGLLPAVATLSLAGAPWPAWWAMVAGSLLGMAAHFANVIPDLEQDARTGIRGLPHRWGASGSAAAAMLLVLGAAVILLLGPAGPAGWRWAVLGVLVLAAAAGGARLRRGPVDRWVFRLLVGVAVVDVLVLLLSGTALVTPI